MRTVPHSPVFGMEKVCDASGKLERECEHCRSSLMLLDSSSSHEHLQLQFSCSRDEP